MKGAAMFIAVLKRVRYSRKVSFVAGVAESPFFPPASLYFKNRLAGQRGE
jgi:hypothetical protein